MSTYTFDDYLSDHIITTACHQPHSDVEFSNLTFRWVGKPQKREFRQRAKMKNTNFIKNPLHCV